MTRIVLALLAMVVIGAAAAAAGQDSQPNQKTRAIQRQSPASMIGTIGALLPSLITNVAPLLLLFGIGALVAPALGVGAMGLLREGRRSFQEIAASPLQLAALPFGQLVRPLQGSPQDFYLITQRSLRGDNSALVENLKIIAERVIKALDNADKTYS